MCQLLRSQTVKTRKDHRCHGCADIIPKGNEALLCVSKDSNEIGSAYWCDRCNEYVNNTPELRGECFMYGELRFEVEEYFEHSKKEGES